MDQQYITPRCRVIELDGENLLSASEPSKLRVQNVKVDYTPMTSGFGDSNRREDGSSMWDEE